MIYKDHTITANVADWHQYELNEDGTLGDFMGNGGIDADSAEYDIRTIDEAGDDELVDGGYDTIEQAKTAIDQRITEATTFQSEAGN